MVKLHEFDKLLTITDNKPREAIMNKKEKQNGGVKDAISKLYILRDSCAGTCITQKDNPHIIWFEGAALLLQQGVDKLKTAQDKVDSGSPDAGKDFACSVKETVSKLTVLKRSWVVSGSEETDENLIWFAGAESIITEVIDQLQQAAKKTETQAAAPAPAVSPKEAKEAEVEEEVEKQAAAG
jgi:hypothetical protein